MGNLFGLNQFFLTILIFMPFERLFAARPQKIFRPGLITDLMFLFLNAMLVSGGLIIIITVAIFVHQSILPSAVKQAIDDLPYLVQAALVLVIGDFGVYWTHRTMHVVPAMWHIHTVHHAVEELDWLAAAHHHPIDLIFMKAGSLFPLFALGFSTEAMETYFLINYWQAFLVHANVRLHYGPLRYVLVSPEFHHWHHSSLIEARDKNFASIFSFYDLLFRTVFVAKGQKPKTFGVDSPMPTNYLALLGYPLVKWASTHKREDVAGACPRVDP